jgi:bacillithiol system protein YtxJ
MGLFSRNTTHGKLNWLHLTSEKEFNDFLLESEEKPVAFFKHSTRCSISSMAKDRLENTWNLEEVVPVYLDLIAYRDVSNLMAQKLNVPHESPQLLLVKNGKCIYHASHSDIRTESLKNYII